MIENEVFIISGEQGEGKTTRLIAIVDLLKSMGCEIQGFYAKGKWKDDQRAGFDIVDLRTNTSKILCHGTYCEGFEQIGRFYFDPSAIKYGEDLLRITKDNSPDLLVIDEIGMFELEGKVWADIFKETQSILLAPLIITVRTKFVEEVITTFKLTNYQVFDLSQSTERIIKYIYDSINC